MFIKLTQIQTDKKTLNPIWINVDNIAYFDLDKKDTAIVLTTDVWIMLKETPEQILKLIKEVENERD